MSAAQTVLALIAAYTAAQREGRTDDAAKAAAAINAIVERN